MNLRYGFFDIFPCCVIFFWRLVIVGGMYTLVVIKNPDIFENCRLSLGTGTKMFFVKALAFLRIHSPVLNLLFVAVAFATHHQHHGVYRYLQKAAQDATGILTSTYIGCLR